MTCAKCLQEAAVKAGKLKIKYDYQRISLHNVKCPKRRKERTDGR